MPRSSQLVLTLVPAAVWQRCRRHFPEDVPPYYRAGEGLPAAFEPRLLRDGRAVLAGIVLVLRDGRRWRGFLGDDLPSGRTCWHWWAWLQRLGVWPRLWDVLAEEHLGLDRQRALALPTVATYHWGDPARSGQGAEPPAGLAEPAGPLPPLPPGWGRLPRPLDPPAVPRPPGRPPRPRPAWTPEARALVSDWLWDVVSPLLPSGVRRKCCLTERQLLSGVLWALDNGRAGSWESLPGELGCGSSSVLRAFFWQAHRHGTWRRLLAELDSRPAEEWSGLPWVEALRPFAELPADVGMKCASRPRPAYRPPKPPPKPRPPRPRGPRAGSPRGLRPAATYRGLDAATWDQVEQLLPAADAPDWLRTVYPITRGREVVAGVLEILARGLPWRGSLGPRLAGAPACRAWLAWWNAAGHWPAAAAVLQAHHPLADKIDWTRSFLR